MRKSSYLLLALAAMTPWVIGWRMDHFRREYEDLNGVPPDGKGLLGTVVFGVLIMFVMLMVAASLSALAYQQMDRPRPLSRTVELLTFLVLPPALLLFTYLVILGRGG
jgi:hypothetical protein